MLEKSPLCSLYQSLVLYILGSELCYLTFRVVVLYVDLKSLALGNKNVVYVSPFWQSNPPKIENM